MCGIFGYMGASPKAATIVLDGLKNLEYRGYDSWGIAVRMSDVGSRMSDLVVEKHVGAIGVVNLKSKVLNLKSNIAIGHTRWATHGGVSNLNAHPHYSSDGSFVLAQNGMVENFEDLKQSISKKGYRFETETDTEVIVRLIEEKVKSLGNFEKAVRKSFLELKGRNTIIILTREGKIIACRNGSPLVIGKSSKEELFFSSDTLSFADSAQEVFVADNGQMVTGEKSKVRVLDIKSGKKVAVKFEKMAIRGQKVVKNGFENYMIKEIFETPRVIRSLTNQNKKQYLDFARAVRAAKKVYTIGSGTAGVAAAQIAYFLRSIAKIDAVSLVGADALEYVDLMGKRDLIIAPSQSGETADVLEILEKVSKKRAKIASFVNMPGSMMTKMSDFKFMAGAGPEIAVISTKVFTSQMAWGYLVAKTVRGDYKSALLNLKNTASAVEKYLKNKKNVSEIKKIAKALSLKKDIFLLGKAGNFQIVREGMVKIIECSYKHAHAMPAGDLKHYAITLMEKGVPVVVLVSNDEVKDDLISAVSQVSARGAEVFAFSPFYHKDFAHHVKIPDLGEVGPIFNVVLLQLLAYFIALTLGNNVDRPRNIAKSVTVK